MKSNSRQTDDGSLALAELPSSEFLVPETPVDGDRQRVNISRRHDIYATAKPLFDIVLATALLVVLSPVIFVAALATKALSPGPAFYWQTRLGRGGRPFRICKIRTMIHNAESETGAVWSPERDPRVTPLGRFLRRSHIDEFPQLFQVIAGHMSLVGPRPERPEFVQRLQWDVPNYLDRLQVKPGVTGLAQLVLPPDSNVDDVRRKVECDLYYIERYSLWFDLVIGVHTAWLLVKAVIQTASSPFRLPSRGDVEQTLRKKNSCNAAHELAIRGDLL